MKKNISICLVILCIMMSGISHAWDICFEWDPNIETDLAGYRMHYGYSSGKYDVHIDVGNVTTYCISGLGNGFYYFAATAYNTSELESDYSNEVTSGIPRMKLPSNIQIKK
jgi:hypothetical protein